MVLPLDIFFMKWQIVAHLFFLPDQLINPTILSCYGNPDLLKNVEGNETRFRFLVLSSSFFVQIRESSYALGELTLLLPGANETLSPNADIDALSIAYP